MHAAAATYWPDAVAVAVAVAHERSHGARETGGLGCSETGGDGACSSIQLASQRPAGVGRCDTMPACWWHIVETAAINNTNRDMRG